MSRLGGAQYGFKFPEGTGGIDRLEVWSESLADAPAAITYRMGKLAVQDGSKFRQLFTELRSPDVAAIARASDRSETLIAEAQALDARLVRRPSWVRGIEGETACPSLLMAGEEAAFFARRRTDTATPASGEAVLVTVSTDSSEVSADSLAAFIATVQIVQQFRPVHVVWQGAWMASEYAGFVFHVPLVTGDMDFERLAFVINSELRDMASFAFMVRRAISVTRKRWSDPKGKADKPATQSYLPGSVDFIDHAGIAADAESIAARACRWLGWEAPWSNRYNESRVGASALCRWDEGEAALRAPYVPTEYSDEQRAEWTRKDRETAARLEADKAEAARRRLAAVQ